MSDEHARQVLDERARALARPVEEESAAAVVEVLTFTLGRRSYGVESRHVREVVRGTDLFRVAGAPTAVLGVVNVRGQILPVADLRRLLGAPSPEAVGGRLVVLDGTGPPVVLLVDEVHDLVSVPAADLVPPGPEAGPAAGLLLGITPQLLVLDGDALLSDPRLESDPDRREP